MTPLEAERLLEQSVKEKDGDKLVEAENICNLLLNDNPDDWHALFVLGRCYIEASRYGTAANLYRRVADIVPDSSHAWNNLGFCMHTLQKYQTAEEYFNKAIELDPTNFEAYNNMASLFAAQSQTEKALRWAEWAKYWASEPGHYAKVEQNIALPLLGTGQWKRGWEAFEFSLGDKWRRDRQYASEGHWDGTPGQTVVLYGEQGIGDEIMFGSIIPDAIRDCKEVIIECDRRLESLFRRTFTTATVYGTRHDKRLDWPAQHKIDARCAFGSLAKFYRSAGEFPRKSYLVTAPANLTRSKPLIGIAWTGGTKITGTTRRSLSVEQVCWLRDRRPDLQFVSLEYKGDDCPDGILDPRVFTRSPNYDDTASLVASLDKVVSVTTAVALLAGAIGKECHVACPEAPTWHWGYSGEMPWFDIKLYRSKGDWQPVLEQIAEAL